MKIWAIVFIIFGCLASVVFYQNRVEKKLYLKKETMLRHLKHEPFLAKQPPSWMQEQIEEDFRGIEQITIEAVDATFAKLRHLCSMIVRYRIVNNELYRYFVEGEPISLRDGSTEKALKTLLQSTRIPDMDFIVSYFDGIPLEPFFPSNVFHTNPQAPLLCSAKLKNVPYVVLIPDQRSIGHWWMSDIKAIKRWNVPWEQKKEFAVWRGSWTKLIRRKLCQLSAQNPDRLDAKFCLKEADPERQKLIDEFMGDRVSWEEFLQCKYLPYVDGVMCAAPAMQWRLLSHSVIFKPDSEEIQWFYRILKPYVHYVPVKADLSDLIEKMDWAGSHDSECKEIAERAAQFAKENLMYGDVLFYFSLVLKHYGSLSQLDSKRLKREIKENPRWVKIQYRSELKKEAERQKMQGFTLEATPTN